jgi:hypothetical protein
MQGERKNVFDSKPKLQGYHDEMNGTNYRVWLDINLIPIILLGGRVLMHCIT